MKKLTILTLFMIYCNMCCLAQGIMKLDKSKINEPYYKGITEYLTSPVNGVYFSTFGKEDVWPDPAYCTKSFYVKHSNGTNELADDISVSILDSTKGNFMVTYVAVEIMGSGPGQEWIFTMDYNGNKIDSLVVCTWYNDGESECHYSDCVSKIDSALNIYQTRVYFQNDLENCLLSGKSSLGNGYRKDFVYCITEKGTIELNGYAVYIPKEYTKSELVYSEEGTIRNGTEKTYVNNLTNSPKNK